MTDLPATREVTRAVMIGQALFTAGFALSSGGFLHYFAYEFEPSALAIAVLLIIPETVGLAGVFARSLSRRFRSRKWVWIGCLLAARCFALVIPLIALAGASLPIAFSPLIVLLCALAVAEVFQSIGYIAYLSWLSDLVPSYEWGRFFARRRVAMLGVMLSVPIAAVLLRNEWLDVSDRSARFAGYAGVFVCGEILKLISIVPLLRFPDRWRSQSPSSGSWRVAAAAIAERSFRYVLIYGWWLAFFQGLVQSVFFHYRIRVLGISLAMFLTLEVVMYGLQIPASLWGGRLSDRIGDRRPLIAGLLVVSTAMVFWLLASEEAPHWLFAAYAVWGLFGLINICQRNLVFALAPGTDNALHLGLFRQTAGLVAGAAGLLGAWLLDQALADDLTIRMFGWAVGPYHALFAISALGRVTAALWLLPVRDPRLQASGTVDDDGQDRNH